MAFHYLNICKVLYILNKIQQCEIMKQERLQKGIVEGEDGLEMSDEGRQPVVRRDRQCSLRLRSLILFTPSMMLDRALCFAL